MVVLLFAELRAPLTVRSPPEASTSPGQHDRLCAAENIGKVVFGSTRCALVPVPSVGSQIS